MEVTLVCALVSTLMFAGNIVGATAKVELVPIDSAHTTIVNGQKQPLAKFATLYTDECGATYIKHCKFEGMSFKSYSPPAAPQWLGLLPYEPANLTLAILPVDYVGEWHTAPGPQFVVCLSGAWSLQATNGQVLRQYPGDWHFDGDTGSKPRPNDDRVGHLTRTIGNEPCVQLIIPLKNHPKVVCE